MQTLKTAIVVLLLMTVMYGSYVSLTTPPEPLPDAVASLIQESDTFELNIEDGLSDSLASLPFDAGQDLASVAPAVELPNIDVPPLPSSSGPAAADKSAVPPTSVAGTRLDGDSADTPPVGPSAVESVDIEDWQLPKPEVAASTPQADPNREYPTTDSGGLKLPDPNSLAALPSTGWKKDATPISYELPNNRTDVVTATLSDTPAAAAGFSMPAAADANDPPSLAASAPGSATGEPNLGLANAIRTADRQYAADQHLEALATLSLFYNSPDLSQSDRDALLSRLDPLAASVIYSRRHLMEQPHRVAANETLMEIATRFEIPWQLLANINGLTDPVAVLPGTELKVVRGPFRAEVDLQRNELTIFLRDLYAGRFPITVGAQPAPQAGTYTIQDKQSARTFYDQNGSPVPPGDARNPYGSVWMDLGKQLSIHGSPDRAKGTDRGCISLRGVDAEDLYGILSQGSSVTIRR